MFEKSWAEAVQEHKNFAMEIGSSNVCTAPLEFSNRDGFLWIYCNSCQFETVI